MSKNKKRATLGGKPTTTDAPAITECRFCLSSVKLVENAVIYGRNYGWPWVYLCEGCGAYVGTHPNTKSPLGTIADKQTREARKSAHAAFDRLWREDHMQRGAAYQWLADKLGHTRESCHIGMFEVEQCAAVVYHSNQYFKGLNKCAS